MQKKINSAPTIDLVEYVKARYEWRRTGSGVVIRCPFHNDENPSMYVTHDGAYCFACGKGYAPGYFIRMTGGKEIEAPKSVARQKKKVFKTLDPEIISVANKILLLDNQRVSYLVGRGISRPIIKKYKIGYIRPPFGKHVHPRYAFPAWNINGDLATISYRQDPRQIYDSCYPENKKYVVHAGTSIIIYNEHKLNEYDWVVYAGGQIDCLSLLTHGIPAVGAIGETTFKSEWTSLFAGKTVYILLDNDEAGALGSAKIKSHLHDAIVVPWPEGSPEKYDINSAITDKEFGIGGIRRILKEAGAPA